MRGDWQYLDEGVQRGPIKDADLRDLIEAKVIRAESPVWRPGMAGWAEASVLLDCEASEVAAEPATATAPSSRKPVNGYLIAWQVLYLLLALPGMVGYWVLGRMDSRLAWWLFGFDHELPVMLLGASVTVLSVVCVIAMFWRKRWAVYAFLAVNSVVFLLPASVAAEGPYPSLGLYYALVYLSGMLLLLGAIKLGGSSAGWSTFDQHREVQFGEGPEMNEQESSRGLRQRQAGVVQLVGAAIFLVFGMLAGVVGSTSILVLVFYVVMAFVGIAVLMQGKKMSRPSGP